MPARKILFDTTKKGLYLSPIKSMYIGFAVKKYKHKTLSGKVKISINLPENILRKMDEKADEIKSSRSDWITRAIIEKMVSDENKNKET
jgi:hypothetical protein